MPAIICQLGKVVLAAGLLAGVARAGDRPPRTSKAGPAGPYCGLYALYGALRSEGVNVDFEGLVSERYLRSPGGSSLEELRQAAADCGAHAEPFERLTPAALRACKHPVIVHVRRPGHGTPYKHWVLFMGVENGRARIVDRPDRMDLWPLAELMAYTDGAGLVVSARPDDTTALYWASWLDGLAAVALTAVFLGGVLVLGRRSGRAGTAAALVRAVTLAGAGVGAALVWHAVRPEGYFRNPVAVGQVALRHLDAPIGSANADEMRAWLAGGATVIDARPPAAYQAGHIPGAINLPVNAAVAEREDILADIPLTTRVVVYCQSEDCGWADSVASDMWFRGYRDVSVYRGGINEWRKHGRPSER